MPDLRFLISARWIGFAVFVIVLSAVCIVLGNWQFGKLDDRSLRNHQITDHFDRDPVPLDEVVPPGEDVSAGDEWTIVTVSGTYDREHEVTVKYLSRDSRPGVDVVTPLMLDDGTAILVDRGFVQTERTSSKPDVPTAPTGTVEVTGWVRVDSKAGGEATSVHDGQIRAISSTGYADHVDYELRSGYLNLQEQSPVTDGIEPEPIPDLSSGPHFFYGLQWWFFAALALTGFVWFARAEKLERAANQAKATRSA